LLTISINTIIEKIEEEFGISATKDEINKYIRENKASVNHYSKFSKVASEYGKATMKLMYYLTRCQGRIRNLIFIYDDLESIPPEQQNSLVLDLLAFSACIGNAGISNKTIFKLMFCTRVSSFSNMSGSEQYNNHRPDPPIVLFEVPEMDKMFVNRFEEFESYQHEEELITPQERETWENSRNVLVGVTTKGFQPNSLFPKKLKTFIKKT